MATNLTNSTDSVQWAPPGVPSFESRLNADLEYAVTQGSIFFEDRGAVQETMKRIASRLEEAGIPYAVCGGMALYRQGFRRFTEDVDILVTREGLDQLHELLEGRGFLKTYQLGKTLRDTTNGVKVEFLITGEFPGDGLPNEVAFPDPVEAAELSNDVKVLSVPWLITLKLASGLTGRDREKDFVDVSALIKARDLPLVIADLLPAMVREKYVELWKKYDGAKPDFILVYRGKFDSGQESGWDSFRKWFPDHAEQSHAMERDGLTLERRAIAGDREEFVVRTRSQELAQKYSMIPEGELKRW